MKELDWHVRLLRAVLVSNIRGLIHAVDGMPLLTLDVSTGHQGQHGHEFLEFEYSRGRLRYANNSNYRNDSLIRKESEYCYVGNVLNQLSHLKKQAFPDFSVWVGQLVVQQIRQLVEDSEIMKEDDAKWPKKNVVGRQELEIRLGNEHISFEVGPSDLHTWGSGDGMDAYMDSLWTDGQARFFGRSARLGRSRRSSCLLLSRSRSQGLSFFARVCPENFDC